MNIHHLKTAYYNLRSAGLRTILAMLGILVGTGAVVAMVSTGQMATEEALKQFKKLGTDLIAVTLSNPSSKEDASGGKKVDLEIAEGIINASPEILLVAPYTGGYGYLTYLEHSGSVEIIGATENLAKVVNIRMRLGRFVSSLDYLEKYCVIGNKIYEQLKKFTENPINTRIKLNNQIYTIVGVVEPFPETPFLYQDINNSVIVPIMTARFIGSEAEISNIVMKLAPDANIEAVEKSIKDYFAEVGIKKELFFRTAQELIKNMSAQSKIFTLLLSLIGSISLLVGGIGVMNIMLVSVMERRREIGIRLALGARRKEIQLMFLTEAVLLSVLGGGLGVLIGLFFSFLVAVILQWDFILFLLPPLVGFIVSVFIGIFFGYYPAHKAAKLSPIQTLRAE